MTKSTPLSSSVTNYDFLILALAHKPYLYSDIDTLYEKDKIHCIEAYHTSSFKQSPALLHHTTMKQVYIQKLAGLFAFFMNQSPNGQISKHKSMRPLLMLVKKGYKYAWNYVQNKPRIVLDLFSYDYMRRIGEENVRDLDLAFNETVVLFLADLENKDVDTRGTMFGLLQHFIREVATFSDVRNQTFSDSRLQAQRQNIEKLRDTFYLGRSRKEIDVGGIFERIISKETEQLPSFNAFNVVECRKQIFKEGSISRYIGAASGVLKTFGLHELEIAEACKLSAKDLDELFYTWLHFQQENALPNESQEMFIVFTSVLKALADEYKQTKKYYVETVAEEQYQDLLSLQRTIEQERKAAKKEAESARLLQHEMSSERMRYEQELQALRTELQQTKQMVAKRQSDQQELMALRQYVYHQSQSDTSFTEADEDVLSCAINFLKKERIAVLGGHVKWQQKLKKRLPHITFLNPENKNTDLSFLNHPNMHLFVNTATNSHAFMARVFAQLDEKGATLHYLNQNSHIERTILYMKTVIEEAREQKM